MTSNNLSWSQLTQWRSDCFRQFGSIRDLPVVSPDEEIVRMIEGAEKVLDIGAGVHKPLQSIVSSPHRRYYSLDNDPLGTFDFHSFDDVPEDLYFDATVGNQVLEHLTILESVTLLESCYLRLSDCGVIVLTVPNVAHPVRYWSDVTHVTHWSMVDLYSVVRNAGFHIISIARYNKHKFPKSFIKRYITNVVSEVFRMDWCDSLLMVGKKKNET